MTIQHTPILQLPYPQSTDSADVPRDVQALAEKLDSPAGAGGIFIVGEVRFIAISTAPRGWLPCDGAPVSRTTYAALFAAIAAVYGPGDGSTTFNVPDLRGRTPVGAGQGSGLIMRTAGTRWGVEAVVLSMPQMPAHAHNGATGGSGSTLNHRHFANPNSWFQITNLTAGLSPDGGAQPGWFPNTYAATTGDANANLDHVHTIPSNGGNEAHDNTPPSLAIPAYIFAGVITP